MKRSWQLEGKPEPRFVQVVSSIDVLLGRGHGPNDHSGNTYYRSLVKEVIPKYKLACRHGDKTRIARQIVAAIHAKKGRFLRRLEPRELQEMSQNKETMPLGEAWRAQGVGIYEVIDDETVLVQKTKQAFRHCLRRGPKSRPRVGAGWSSSTLATSTSTPSSLASQMDRKPAAAPDVHTQARHPEDPEQHGALDVSKIATSETPAIPAVTRASNATVGSILTDVVAPSWAPPAAAITNIAASPNTYNHDILSHGVASQYLNEKLRSGHLSLQRQHQQQQQQQQQQERQQALAISSALLQARAEEREEAKRRLLRNLLHSDDPFMARAVSEILMTTGTSITAAPPPLAQPEDGLINVARPPLSAAHAQVLSPLTSPDAHKTDQMLLLAERAHLQQERSRILSSLLFRNNLG